MAPAAPLPPSSGPLSARSNHSNAAVPFLPGYSQNEQPKSGRKGQSLGYALGGNTISDSLPPLDINLVKTMQNPMHRYDLSARSKTHDEREAIRESARNTYRPAIEPAWLKHDRQVLRFFAYFQEPVHENPKENFRVRHCVINFYLEDGTMMVVEPKIENSGMPQGTFVKRHRIPKVGAGYYTYEDLTIGVVINIYARAFRILDCDEFTRAFYEKAVGKILPNGEDAPIDSFHGSTSEAGKPTPRNREIAEGKEYMELALGGSRRNGKLQQYLENDRKVLSFKCYWDDPTRYGSRMYYVLHYYLADDSVEILENLARNSGRDPYPVLWRRSPLRKNPYVSPAPGMLEPEPIIYKPEDFNVGQTIKVYGRDITLYDCDDFTRSFYSQYNGVQQESNEINHPEVRHVKLSHPPHTGFGTEEDSLASCLHLTPRPPRRDINKLMTDADKVMRFQGQMLNEQAQDKHRKFVVACYPADDSVGVWELKQRNSGHSEGKFALKSKKRNPATGQWFKCQDFYVGAVVEINSTPFFLVAADEGTMRFMEECKEEFPLADIGLIAKKFVGLEGELAKANAISIQDLQSLVGGAILQHEILTMQRACPCTDPGAIDTGKLLEAMNR